MLLASVSKTPDIKGLTNNQYNKLCFRCVSAGDG